MENPYAQHLPQVDEQLLKHAESELNKVLQGNEQEAEFVSLMKCKDTSTSHQAETQGKLAQDDNKSFPPGNEPSFSIAETPTAIHSSYNQNQQPVQLPYQYGTPNLDSSNEP